MGCVRIRARPFFVAAGVFGGGYNEPLTLSIVIPAYNEERRLPATLDATFAWLDDSPYRDAEVLVVDDGSTDATVALVESRMAKEPRLRLVRNPGNRGKGYAVRHGMRQAQGDWILFTDADLSAPIEELPRLLTATHEKGSAVAIGSRALDRSLIGVHQSRWRELSCIFFNRVMRLILGQSLGIATSEVPVRWNNVEGTKVSMAHGIASFLDLLRIRWYWLQGFYSD